ncbi:MAG: hypothetical protein QXE80_03535 [Pyrobaculum sp.]
MENVKRVSLSDEFEWMGVKIKKASLKTFIVEIPRYNKKTNTQILVEYLTVEGKIRILDEVCAAKNWQRSIVFEYQFLSQQQREVMISCEIVVKDSERVIAHSKAYSYGTFTSSEEFAKLQTAAFNHAARILGIGVESLDEEEMVEQEDGKQAEQSNHVKEASNLTSEDLIAIERIHAYASKHPEYAEKVKTILSGMGKQSLYELTKQEFEIFKSAIKKFREGA